MAFASLVGSAGKAELSVELVRDIANAPIGILDFVLVEAMLWAKGHDYRTVTYRHGEHYTDFNELRRAKARFAPRWDPRFVSSRPGLALARAIPDLAKLVAECRGRRRAWGEPRRSEGWRRVAHRTDRRGCAGRWVAGKSSRSHEPLSALQPTSV